jgi:GNAT superfamily N-acetyltransferase
MYASDITLGMVTPAAQRMGAGEALLLAAMAAAREAKVPAYLEATRAGEPLYLRNGFKEIGRLRVEGIDAYGTCMLWEGNHSSVRDARL